MSFDGVCGLGFIISEKSSISKLKVAGEHATVLLMTPGLPCTFSYLLPNVPNSLQKCY